MSNKVCKLGNTYTDSLTGFTGIATSRTEYVTGCVHVGLQAKVKDDGTLPTIEYFDESRLDSKATAPGGPAPKIAPANIHR